MNARLPLLALPVVLACSLYGEARSHENISDCERSGGTPIPADAQGRFGTLIRFDAPGAMDRVDRAPGERFDRNTPQASAAREAIEAEHASHLEAIGAAIGRSPTVTHRYLITHSGVSMRLTSQEVQRVLQLPGVASVERECSHAVDFVVEGDAAAQATTRAAAPPVAARARGTGPASKPAGAGTLLSVAGVRTGRHTGFSRVVIELDGRGDDPGFSARYVAVAEHDPSGHTIDIAGDAILEVTVRGWGYPYDTGIENFGGPWPVPGTAGGTVAEVLPGGFFEGQAQFFIGVQGGEKPFVVSTLRHPTRVVVDIAQ